MQPHPRTRVTCEHLLGLDVPLPWAQYAGMCTACWYLQTERHNSKVTFEEHGPEMSHMKDRVP